MLTSDQIASFHKNGYLVVEDAISTKQLDDLSTQFSQWVELSRKELEPFGSTLDNRPRFDLEPGHSSEKPALRRVSSPVEISTAYLDVMNNSEMLDAVAALIGPDVKFHHSKINSKLPGAGTAVKFHQDFLFTPHSNDSLITALLFIDEVTLNNGPLEVVPGSHKGPLYQLWHNGIFTGAIGDGELESIQDQTVSCVGPAGSVCLMHTRLLHGSAPNHSDKPRTLFICVYSAADSQPLSPNPVPNEFDQQIVKGKSSNQIRCTNYEMMRPELPTGASFFNQQSKAD
ncbi:MAG: phytanoyl-CoA dioxygenase family protein [Gammaproteobacteria bacterium]|nr:phytanoyl-CoA dioxygenase family protein [Gammaproteobacteria bacterium]